MKSEKRIIIIISCKACPCRLEKDHIPYCIITGDMIRSTTDLFPESCVLETLKKFYKSLNDITNQGN